MCTQKHYRDMLNCLDARGFQILESYTGGKHFRIRVVRNGLQATLTLAGSPRSKEHAVANTLKQAIRATTPAAPSPGTSTAGT